MENELGSLLRYYALMPTSGIIPVPCSAARGGNDDDGDGSGAGGGCVGTTARRDNQPMTARQVHGGVKRRRRWREMRGEKPRDTATNRRRRDATTNR